MGYHASLAPSAAARWIHCPASVRLCRDIPEQTSEYAEAGRLAHSIAELKARKKFTPMSARTYTSQLKKLQADPSYSKEMEGYTDRYVEVLTEHAMSFSAQPFTALETSVPVGSITGENKEDGSPATGTADCIQIAEGVLWVTDYKNGAGVRVEAEGNPQMLLYALGALELYRPFYGSTVHTVRMTIVQPALDNVSNWETSRERLEAWGREVAAPAAELARSEECEPQPGEWCSTHFCPLRNTCRARANEYLALEAFGERKPPELTEEEIGDVLARAKGLVSWAKGLEEYALQAVLSGRAVPGWKAVEGRSNRIITNPDAAFEALEAAGYPREVTHNWKPMTLTELEAALGKAIVADLLGSFVAEPRGKPTLAPENDKRSAYNAAEVAFGG